MAEETNNAGGPRAVIPAKTKRNRPRRKAVAALEDDNAVLDYKSPSLLRYFVSERGKLLPRRMSGVTPKQQRQLAKAIKRARMIALMPFAAND